MVDYFFININMENKDSNNVKLKNALCYIPLASIILFFTEQNKSNELIKHIKYGTFLFIAYILLRFIIEWILMINLGWFLFIIYIWITGFFWYKVYNWKDINIEYIDEFEKTIKNNLDNKSK